MGDREPVFIFEANEQEGYIVIIEVNNRQAIF